MSVAFQKESGSTDYIHSLWGKYIAGIGRPFRLDLPCQTISGESELIYEVMQANSVLLDT